MMNHNQLHNTETSLSSDRPKEHYTERCEELAHYLIANQTTVRDTASWFGISKSTVHKDVTERLNHVNPGLSAEVRDLFEKNKSERHLRGGEATRKKYMKIKDKHR